MKKLMITAAIVCAAAYAQATAISWSCLGDGIGSPVIGDVLDKNTVVYLFNATTAQDAFVKAFTGADYLSKIQEASTGTGKIGNDGALTVPSGTTTIAGGNESLYTYFVILDADNELMFVSDAQKTSWIGTGDGKYSVDFAAANADDASWANAMKASEGFKGAGWYQAAAVPEPTSGLLLLLGVAGLALRRRRA